MTAKDEAKIDWNLTTWKGSRLQQHREFDALPFRRKLEIIDGLGELASRFHEQRKRKTSPDSSIEKGERVGGAIVREDPFTSTEK